MFWRKEKEPPKRKLTDREKLEEVLKNHNIEYDKKLSYNELLKILHDRL